MDPRKLVWKQTAVMAVGELIAVGLLVGAFFALGRFVCNVLFSALAGAAVMVINHFFMAVFVNIAADKAQKGEVEQAKKLVQLSSLVRLVCMGIVLFLGIRLGANVLALLLPLAFARPILMLAEFFGKKGD